MAFETVKISSTRNGSGAVQGYREDLAVSDAIVCTLTDQTGVSTYQWQLVGRPEGSTAGGAGPEPISLGTASSASWTVDTDTGYRKDGTYVIQCTVNAGSPTETRIRTILCRLAGVTVAGGRNLRKLGGFESLDDTSIPSIVEGWATQLNRWLEAVRQLVSSGIAGQSFALGSVPFGTGTGLTEDNTKFFFADGTAVSPYTANMRVLALGTNLPLQSTQYTLPASMQAGLELYSTGSGGQSVLNLQSDAASGTGPGTSELWFSAGTKNSASEWRPALLTVGDGGAAGRDGHLQVLTNGAGAGQRFGRVLSADIYQGGAAFPLGLAVGSGTHGGLNGQFDPAAGGPHIEFGDGIGASVSPANRGRLRYNNTAHQFEHSDNGGAWAAFGTGSGGAPTTATYIVQTPDGTLANEQALSLNATGLMKSTTTTGVVTTATINVDYQGVLTPADGTIVFPTLQTVRVGVIPDAVIAQGTSAAHMTGAQFLGALGTGLLKNTTTTGVLSIAVAGTDYGAVLTFTQGVTLTGTTVRGDYITGKSGGQTWVGGTAAADPLTIQASSNAASGVMTLQSSQLVLQSIVTKASGASATLDAISVPQQTITVTGGTNITTATGFNFATLQAPIYTDATGVTVTSGATLTIGGAPQAAGSLALTNPYALWVQAGGGGALVRLDGNVQLPLAGTQTMTKSGSGDLSFTVAGAGNLLLGGNSAGAVLVAPAGQIGIGASTVPGAANKVRFVATNLPSVASGAGATLDAFLLDSSTITVTGGTNITTATGFNFLTVRPPTITDGSAVTVTAAATMALIGAPIAASSAVITNSYTLWSQAGANRFDGQVLVGGAVSAPATSAIRVLGTQTLASAAGATLDVALFDAPTITLTGTTTVATAAGLNFITVNAPTYTDASAVTVTHGATLYVQGAPIAGGSLTLTNGYALRIDAGLTYLAGPVGIGAVPPAVTNRLYVKPTVPSVASGASVKLDAILFDSQTVTLSGGTNVTTATGFNFLTVNAPTYTDGTPVTISQGATVTIQGAPIAAGSVTLTNPYALWVQAGATSMQGPVIVQNLTGLLKATAGVVSVAVAGTDYGAALTFSQGVTLAGSNVTGDYITGKAGGQVWTSGTAASDPLTIRSSSNAQPGVTTLTESQLIVNLVPASVASGASVSLDAVKFNPYTVTITGTTTIANTLGFNYMTMPQPVYTSASAVTVNDAATLAITGGPVFSGSTAITNRYAIWVQQQGIRIDGTDDVKGAAIWLNRNGEQDITKSRGLLVIATSDANDIFFSTSNVARLIMKSNGTMVATNTATISATATNGAVYRYNATVATSSGATLDAILYDNSTHTFTGGTNVTTAAGVNQVTYNAPTYTNASAMTVTNAATLSVQGAPIPGGSLGITNPYAFWVQAGKSLFAGITSMQGTVIIQALTGLLKASAGTVTTATAGTDYENALTFSSGLTRVSNAVTGDYITGKAGGQTWSGGTGVNDPLTVQSSTNGTKGLLTLDAGTSFVNLAGGKLNGLPSLNFYGAGNLAISIDTSARVGIGNSISPGVNQTLDISLSRTVASATSATLDAFRILPSTVTVTGGTAITTATGLNLVTIKAPTYSTGAVISHAATLAIGGAPGGSGINNPYAFWVQGGVTRLDGQLGVGGLPAINTMATFVGSSGADRFLIQPGSNIADNSARQWVSILPQNVSVSDGVTAASWNGMQITPVLYGRAGVGTAPSVTNAATLAIVAEPAFSGLFTAPNRYALLVQAGVARFDGGSAIGDPNVIWDVPNYQPSPSPVATTGNFIAMNVRGVGVRYLQLLTFPS